MRVLARTAVALLPVCLFLVVWAQPASACSGGTAPLAAGVRGATSIYYARIVGAGESSVGFFDLRLDVGRVVRGTGLNRISQVIPNQACEPLAVGDSGVVVLGSVDPFDDGRNDVYNFFYVIGPGRTSQAEATAVLSALPPTDAVPVVADRIRAESAPVTILIAIALATFTLAAGHHHRRRAGFHRLPKPAREVTVDP